MHARAFLGITCIVLMAMLTAVDAEAGPRRILVMGDSWPFFMIFGVDPPFSDALVNKGLDEGLWWSGIGVDTVAVGGSEIEDWAYGTGVGAGKLAKVVQYLTEIPTLDMVVVTLGGNDFTHRWDPSFTPQQEEAIWLEAAYGVDGQHGLKLIFDTILAVRPDVKIIFSSYDYIGKDDDFPTMDLVQAYNGANERYTQAIIDFFALEYNDPPRAFVCNHLGLMQHVFGYPGPEPIPAYFWPDGPPDPPHAFRFGPGGSPAGRPGSAPDGYAPLAGGDPDFRISPYVALLDPAIDGWIHLSQAGYVALVENILDQYAIPWLEYPKVYGIEHVTPNPLTGQPMTGPVGFQEILFEVTFSEPVSGVDEADFAVVMGGGLANASVERVDEGKDALTWTIAVNTGSGEGTLGLELMDNNSIQDGESNPLGGPGTHDGYFAYGASSAGWAPAGSPVVIDRSVAGLPVAAWPAALALLALGTQVIRRRRVR